MGSLKTVFDLKDSSRTENPRRLASKREEALNQLTFLSYNSTRRSGLAVACLTAVGSVTVRIIGRRLDLTVRINQLLRSLALVSKVVV